MIELTDDGAPRNKRNSLLYLALLCLLVYTVKSVNHYLTTRDTNTVDTAGRIYVEIDDGTYSTVKVLSNEDELMRIKDNYNIASWLRNGSKVTLDDYGVPRTGRISGLKSLSLGIPIGINSATTEDLEALPGIGEKLALRIIDYRDQTAGFKDTDELLEVNGMGEKKLAMVKPLINLD